jgi:hypothetical protein
MESLARLIADGSDDGGGKGSSNPPLPPPLSPAAAQRIGLALRTLATYAGRGGVAEPVPPRARDAPEDWQESERRRRRRARTGAARALALALAAETARRLEARQQQQQSPLDLASISDVLDGLARLKLYPPGSDLVPRLADEAGEALMLWRRQRRQRRRQQEGGEEEEDDADSIDPPTMARLGRLGASLVELGCPPPPREWRAAFAEAAAEAGRRLRFPFPSPAAVVAVGAAMAAWAWQLEGEQGEGVHHAASGSWSARRHWSLLLLPPPSGSQPPSPAASPGERLALHLSLPQLIQLLESAAVLGGVRPVWAEESGKATAEEADAPKQQQALTAADLAVCLVHVLEARTLGGEKKGRALLQQRQQQQQQQQKQGQPPSSPPPDRRRNAARPELLTAALAALADVAFGGPRGAWGGWLRHARAGRNPLLLFTQPQADEMLLRCRAALASAPSRLAPDGVASLCWAVARLLGGDLPASWADEAALRLLDVAPGLGPGGLSRAAAAMAAARRAPFSALWRAFYARWRVEAASMGRDDALLALEALVELAGRGGDDDDDDEEEQEAGGEPSLPLPPLHEQSPRARRQRQARSSPGRRGARGAGGATGVPDTEALAPLLVALRRAAAVLTGGGLLAVAAEEEEDRGSSIGSGGGTKMSPAEMRRAAQLLRRLYGGADAALPGRGAEHLAADLEARAAFLEEEDDDGRRRRQQKRDVSAAEARRRAAAAALGGSGRGLFD